MLLGFKQTSSPLTLHLQRAEWLQFKQLFLHHSSRASCALPVLEGWLPAFPGQVKTGISGMHPGTQQRMGAKGQAESELSLCLSIGTSQIFAPGYRSLCTIIISLQMSAMMNVHAFPMQYLIFKKKMLYHLFAMPSRNILYLTLQSFYYSAKH